LACDFRDPVQLEDLTLVLRNIEVDILINNAGINKVGVFDELGGAEFLEVHQVNLYAAFRVCQSVLPNMTSNRWGRIVNIASIFGIISKEFRAPYSASKFGLDGMTVALAAEVAKDGVLANCVSPGFIDTELTHKVLGQEGIKEMVERVPAKRLGHPEEIAELVLWLCSGENTYVSGQNIAIDGGFTRV
jgi:3-oxoacyl-[acyl-carrier protein] reductase